NARRSTTTRTPSAERRRHANLRTPPAGRRFLWVFSHTREPAWPPGSGLGRSGLGRETLRARALRRSPGAAPCRGSDLGRDCLRAWVQPPTARLRRVPVADRIAPLAAEGAPRDLRPRRGLVALPLADAHQAQHPVDGGGVEAGADDLVARLLQVDVAAQDRVEHVVGRQRILVE